MTTHSDFENHKSLVAERYTQSFWLPAKDDDVLVEQGY